ncbi:MAG: glycosyltransferase family 2 protein [bacterium]
MPLSVPNTILLVWLLVAMTAPPGFLLLALLWRRTAKSFQPADPVFPPLSVIKPIRGTYAELLGNLASTLTTGYPGAIELLCCVEDEHDSAAGTVRALQTQFPEADIRLIESHGREARFGKHANMLAGYAASKYDTVVFSDADVRLDPGILNELIPPLEHPHLGGATAVFFQTDRPGWGSALMASFVAAYGYSPNLAARQLRMLPNAIGGLMAYRKSLLEELGGLEQIIGDKISDDGALGVAVRATGRELYMCVQPFHCDRTEPGVRAVLANMHRWMLMFKGQGTGAYIQMLVINPMFPLGVLTLRLVAGGSSLPARAIGELWLLVILWEIVWGLATVAICAPKPRNVWAWGVGRPIAELCFAGTWLAALVWPRTTWGGRRYYVPFGGRARVLHRIAEPAAR